MTIPSHATRMCLLAAALLLSPPRAQAQFTTTGVFTSVQGPNGQPGCSQSNAMTGTSFGLSSACLGSESKGYAAVGALKSYARSGGTWQATSIASFQDSFVLTGGAVPDQFAVTFAIDGSMAAEQGISGESYWTLFNSAVDGPTGASRGSASYGDVATWSPAGGATSPFSYVNGATQDVIVVGGTTFVTTTFSLPAGTAWFYFTARLTTYAYSYSTAGSVLADFYNTATLSNIAWLKGGGVITDGVEFRTASGFEYPADSQAAVPEPATLSLLATGVIGLLSVRRRKTRSVGVTAAQ